MLIDRITHAIGGYKFDFSNLVLGAPVTAVQNFKFQPCCVGIQNDLSCVKSVMS